MFRGMIASWTEQKIWTRTEKKILPIFIFANGQEIYRAVKRVPENFQSLLKWAE